MFGLPRHILGVAVLACAVVYCSTNAVDSIRERKQVEGFETDYKGDASTAAPTDIKTKEFRMPLCALPKKGPLLCYAICVFLMNDRGTCKPQNICSCTVAQSMSPAASLLSSIFGK